MFGCDVCSCTFEKHADRCLSAGPVDTAYYYAHTLCCALYCKRHALDNCLGHNHLQVHLFMLLGQRSDGLRSNPRGRACSNMCKYMRRPLLPITFMCVYLVKVALKHWSCFNMPNNCIPFIFFVKAELYSFFPTLPLFCNRPTMEWSKSSY